MFATIECHKIMNILFLCTGNSCRSIMAEAIFNHKAVSLAAHGYSAGAFPNGIVHPIALQVLDKADYSVEGLESKSWDMFSGDNAPVMNMVITLCDEAQGEMCPVLTEDIISAHWSIPDPAYFEASQAQKLAEFQRIMRLIEERIERLIQLLGHITPGQDLAAELAAIGS